MRKQLAIGILALILGILMLGYSYFIEPNRLVVNNATIPIKNLDSAFDGIRILAISDIHGGSNGASEANIRRMVEIANQQNADAIVILGDFISHRADINEVPMHIEKVAELLSPIRAKDGVFAVLGNHDGFYGGERIAKALTNAGIIVLQNQIASIERNGKTLRLLGLKDHMQFIEWRLYAEQVRQVLSNDPHTGDIMVLQHSPDVFRLVNHFKLPGDDFRLMIAGHSHGGQIWLPIIGAPFVPSSFGQKYTSGVIKEEGRKMFVTTGLGTSILPFRFMVPPEIAVLTLKAE